jgi:photosystem II stability/assembly factor-like uncharacterized protein
MRKFLWILTGLSLIAVLPAFGADDDPGVMTSSTFSALKLRLVGPAMTSGRVGDFAVNPYNNSEYYVAVCSGGVWKTVNAGTTYEPVFDGEGSYSIGCLALDPNDPNTVWVGTGENNSQRSVSYGDGVYKSIDGGQHWENVGLKESEHIGMIAIDPRDSKTVFVAAQGPLWRSGDDRGLYKTIDGGATWAKVLDISADTGVSEIHMHPENPDVMFAVAYQRRRHVWTLLNGGPESAVYKSTDGGANWRKLSNGLPSGDVGRIGMDLAPSRPNTVYAIIEAAEGSGFYRSTDAGENWTKQSDYLSTSPQYYQEIVVDPLNPDRVWSLSTWLGLTEDGGKTWDRANTTFKHVDDHAMWIDPVDPAHILLGCDGGIYETWDMTATWHFKPNLPVTQFYKVTVDNAEPFYTVYGGTQDNNTLGAHVGNTTVHGIRNSDWFITQGGDGFEPQVDPTDPNIVYSQYQYGGLARFDRLNGEGVDIQPQPAWGEAAYRFNWNSPLLVSKWDHKRLYYGCQKLLRSDDMGNSWYEISGDLSRGLDRNRLEIMGKVWSVDAVAKNRSTSFYGSLIALDESQQEDGVIYTGTDDGLIQVTRDGGATWKMYDSFGDVPDMSYVGCVLADQHKAGVVYATFDNHKKGDFKPYVMRSDNYGKSWKSIAGDLPERGTVHCIEQDHRNKDLLFVGTEFGLFFTVDGGRQWVQLKNGLPTIAVRDIDIQRRENDLAVGTFGRGIYILDDYSPLRDVTGTWLENEAAIIFPVKDALMFNKRSPMGSRRKGSQGDSFYSADNPEYGAVFTYYLKDELKSRKAVRQERESTAMENEETVHYPSWNELKLEDREQDPLLILKVTDTNGRVVRRIKGAGSAGLHRVSWDLRDPSLSPAGKSFPDDSGTMVMPGEYIVSMSSLVDGTLTEMGNTRRFKVKPLGAATLPNEDRDALVAFQRKCARLSRAVDAASNSADEADDRMGYLRAALFSTVDVDQSYFDRLEAMRLRLLDLRIDLEGNVTVERRSEPVPPSLSERIGRVMWGSSESTAAPTGTHQETYRVVAEIFPSVLAKLEAVLQDLEEFEEELEAMGAPWTPGRIPAWKAE